MIGTKLTRYGRGGVLIVVLFTVVLGVFVVGAQRQARRLGVLGPAHAQIRARATERSQQVEAWQPGREAERDVWQRIATRFAQALAAEQPRLCASGEITALAEACGLRDVALIEVREERAPGLDYGEEDWDLGEEEQREAGLWTGITGDDADVRVGRYEYEMTFWADHAALMTFLSRLGREEVLIEAQSIRLRREPPGIRVELLLAAYGREG